MLKVYPAVLQSPPLGIDVAILDDDAKVPETKRPRHGPNLTTTAGSGHAWRIKRQKLLCKPSAVYTRRYHPKTKGLILWVGWENHGVASLRGFEPTYPILTP